MFVVFQGFVCSLLGSHSARSTSLAGNGPSDRGEQVCVCVCVVFQDFVCSLLGSHSARSTSLAGDGPSDREGQAVCSRSFCLSLPARDGTPDREGHAAGAPATAEAAGCPEEFDRAGAPGNEAGAAAWFV